MADQPNILFIMSDQHNAKCTGWGEYPEPVHTPNLERLAAEGVRFDRCFTQNPICTPSRTSFLTGQYPTNHGYYGLSSRYGDAPTEIPSLFEITQQFGYRTGAFGKLHVPHGLFDPYIDVIQATSCSPIHEVGKTPYDAHLDAKGLERDRQGNRIGRPARLDREDIPEYWATRQAQEFIGETGSDEPFCAWLSFQKPHGPYIPHEEFWELYPPAEELELPPSVDEDLSDKPPHQAARRENLRRGMEELDDERPYETLRRTKLRGYLGSISMNDDCVGRMLDFLEAEGLREDTIVIYTADHGDFALEHGNIDKQPGVSYDAITRVPSVWSWPDRFESGATRSQLVGAVDLLPTLISLLTDGGVVESADGEDLTGLLTGDDLDQVRQYVVTENVWTKSIRTEDQRLTVYPSGFFGPDSDQYFEFYDYTDDPWEMTNLAVDNPDAVADDIDRHRALLHDFLATTNRPWTVQPERAGESRGDESEDSRYGDHPSINPDNIHQYLRENEGGTNI